MNGKSPNKVNPYISEKLNYQNLDDDPKKLIDPNLLRQDDYEATKAEIDFLTAKANELLSKKPEQNIIPPMSPSLDPVIPNIENSRQNSFELNVDDSNIIKNMNNDSGYKSPHYSSSPSYRSPNLNSSHNSQATYTSPKKSLKPGNLHVNFEFDSPYKQFNQVNTKNSQSSNNNSSLNDQISQYVPPRLQRLRQENLRLKNELFQAERKLEFEEQEHQKLLEKLRESEKMRMTYKSQLSNLDDSSQNSYKSNVFKISN